MEAFASASDLFWYLNVATAKRDSMAADAGLLAFENQVDEGRIEARESVAVTAETARGGLNETHITGWFARRVQHIPQSCAMANNCRSRLVVW